MFQSYFVIKSVRFFSIILRLYVAYYSNILCAMNMKRLFLYSSGMVACPFLMSVLFTN